MAGTLQERLAVAERINAVQYAEYASVGWVKAVGFAEVVRYDATEQAIIHHWHVDRDDRVCLQALDVILESEMTWSTPESIGTPSFDWMKWEPATEPHARRIVDAVLGGSDPESLPSVPYEQLREWFFDSLFDPDTVHFLAPANGPPYDRYHRPIVVGIDHGVVAMFWLE